MPTPEEIAAADEERIRALAEAAAGDPPPEEQDDPPADPGAGDPPSDGDEQDDPPPSDGDELDQQDPPADPGAGDPSAEGDEPPPAPRRPRSLEGRISTLATEKRTLLQRNAELEEQLRLARGGQPPPTGDDPPADPGAGDPPQRTSFATQADFDAAVRAEAQRQADARAFNDRCNAVEDAGVAVDAARWASAKRTLGLLDDNGVIPMALLEPALETEKPELVLLALGEDPDRAAALLAMSPTKRAMEIAKMTATPRKPPAAPVRSLAPPPVEPIGRRATAPAASQPTDRDSDEEWLRKRNAELNAKRRAERAAQA